MAEQGTGNAIANTAASIVIVSGTQSSFAKSLLSASFDQIINGHFYWQLSDVLTLVCSGIVIANYLSDRARRRGV